MLLGWLCEIGAWFSWSCRRCVLPIHPTSGMFLTPESPGRVSNGICPTPTSVQRVRFEMLPGTGDGEQCGNDESGMPRYARSGDVHYSADKPTRGWVTNPSISFIFTTKISFVTFFPISISNQCHLLVEFSTAKTEVPWRKFRIEHSEPIRNFVNNSGFCIRPNSFIPI